MLTSVKPAIEEETKRRTPGLSARVVRHHRPYLRPFRSLRSITSAALKEATRC